MKKLIALVVVVVIALTTFAIFPNNTPTANAQGTYETTTAANARSCPKVSCSIVTRLARGTVINGLEIVEGDRFNGKTTWIKFEHNGRTAYVHSTLTKTTSVAPTTGNNTTSSSSSGNNTTAGSIPTQETPPPAPVSEAPLVCGTCSQMRDCAHAMACLAAGHTRLDRDNDGIPCESICR